MATAVETSKRTLEGEQRFVLRDIGWEGYESLLAMVGDGHVRLTFDGKDVELMSPSQDHESLAVLIGRIITTVAEELDIPCLDLRTTTWRKRVKEKGLEADNCFYFHPLPDVRRRRQIDLTVDRPPGLAVEVEISRSALDRMSVYAMLGVPEVWRYDGETLGIDRLQPDGSYLRVEVSPNLAVITPEEVVYWIVRGDEIGNHSAFGRQLRAWVREELLPRQQTQ